jgi:hypothetical protein
VYIRAIEQQEANRQRCVSGPIVSPSTTSVPPSGNKGLDTTSTGARDGTTAPTDDFPSDCGDADDVESQLSQQFRDAELLSSASPVKSGDSSHSAVPAATATAAKNTSKQETGAVTAGQEPAASLSYTPEALAALPDTSMSVLLARKLSAIAGCQGNSSCC